MDPFECHNEFSKLLLQNLSSARVVFQIIEFCYAQIENSEVIYQVLMDFLKEKEVIKRLTIFYLLDALVKQVGEGDLTSLITIQAPEKVYGKLILRNLKEIVDLTVDYQGKQKIKNQEKSGGFSNIMGVRKVLGLWAGKQILTKEAHEKMDKYLVAMLAFERYCMSNSRSSGASLSKDAIWRRMEDDRDRQKRAREDSWTRTAPHLEDSPDPEFKAAWMKCKPLSDADFQLFKKLNDKYI